MPHAPARTARIVRRAGTVLPRALRIWAISEVTPAGVGGGHATMRRHFVERSAGAVVWSHPADVLIPRGGRPGEALAAATERTRLGPLLTGLRPLWEPAASGLVPRAEPVRNLGGPADLIFTVAHGTAWLAAQRVARATGKPLVTVFHDWYPDVPAMPAALRAMWDRAFRRLATDSAAALCVSGGMVKELGSPPSASVLPPIPADPPARSSRRPRRTGEPVRLFYAGLCGGAYAGPLTGLVRAVAADPRFALDLCGPQADCLPADPAGPGARGRVRLHGDVPAARRQALARTADAAIVVLPFDERFRRHLRTHFPSKLIEYCGLGVAPLVWGPGYSTGAAWAGESGAATAVTDADPAAALAAARRSLETGGAARVAAAAAGFARGEFAPHSLHERLLGALHAAAGIPRPRRGRPPSDRAVRAAA